ncbi:hypothetical protein MNBD_ALPHA06-257 [hydrothermal vent metagenome]|uniref:Periplasmic protein n=1 Tax=hydrothermal vent metagenome TaxID=652676 RepID=A0A3B0RA90_9ZZZZ
MLRFALILAIALFLPARASGDDLAQQLSLAAIERTRHHVTYDGRYVSITYPGGDVAANTGVCTDVVIRSYRAIGTDLQVLVHEDMKRAFDAYPNQWNLQKPDRNIDHRRVPNLRTFFTRNGQSLPISQTASDYKPGDLVSWMLPGNKPHIGVVTDKMFAGTNTPMLVHNVGAGPQLENVLFAWPMTGHYRYQP